MKASAMYQYAASVERALPGRTTLTVNVTDSRGVHDLRQRQINAPLPGTVTDSNSLGIKPYPGLGNLYLYESSGIYKELQVITSANTRVNSHVALNGYWAWTDYHTNTNGFPMNQYDTSLDWGPAGIPSNRFFLIGTVGLPWGWTASPSFSASTADRFNITAGKDLNNDGVNNDRPAFAPAGATCGVNGIVCTPYGSFNTQPGPGYTPIPVNFGKGYSRWDTDVRFSRSWGWGENRNVAAATGGGGRGPGGPGGGGGGRGGGRGGGGGFGGGRGGGFGRVGGGSSHKYNVGLTVAITDIFNHVNLADPNSSLDSALFGQSLNAISTGQGLGRGAVTGTRRVQLTLRFTY
jgi:hypothetical protein